LSLFKGSFEISEAMGEKVNGREKALIQSLQPFLGALRKKTGEIQGKIVLVASFPKPHAAL
jgi:hypothetical protein